MKRILLVLGIIVLLCLAGMFAYKVCLPKMIADGITDEASYLMPNDIKEKLEAIREPVNEGALTVVETAHKSGVTMEQIMRAIDNAKESQLDAMLLELKDTQIESTDQVFSIAKKHFPVDFDVEIFRKPFNDRVELITLKRAIRQAVAYLENEDIDEQTAKAIAKRILLQKEDEFKRLTQLQK